MVLMAYLLGFKKLSPSAPSQEYVLVLLEKYLDEEKAKLNTWRTSETITEQPYTRSHGAAPATWQLVTLTSEDGNNREQLIEISC